jgi:hypothetical protein
MLEVIDRFPKIGTIEDYQALEPGKRILYNEYTKYKIEQEARTAPALRLEIPRKGG